MEQQLSHAASCGWAVAMMGAVCSRDSLQVLSVRSIKYQNLEGNYGIVNGNIYAIIKQGLKNSLCLAFMENLDFKYHAEVNDDYLCPDVMIICDRKYLKGGAYSGVPRFIVETLSPSTAKRDRTEKKDIYEKAGVEEYWIVSPQGAVEIYYMEEGKYVLEHSYLLQDDKEEEDYNAETSIALRAFPHIKITLGEIFEGVDG